MTYIDESGKKRIENIGKIWRLDNYLGTEAKKRDFKSSMYLSEFNCDTEETRVTSDNYYDGKMGSGNPVHVDNIATPWVPVVPNTVADLIMKIACRS